MILEQSINQSMNQSVCSVDVQDTVLTFATRHGSVDTRIPGRVEYHRF